LLNSFEMEPQNMNPSSKDILIAIALLTSQFKESTLQTSLTTSNFEIECVDVESDEQSDEKSGDVSDEQSGNEFEEQLKLYKGQVFQTVEEAHIVVESFAHSNGFGIRKGRVEKDVNGQEISRSFLCHHDRKLSTTNTSHNTNESGSCRTGCNWKVNIYW
ncbi:244_t:CDS:2, partial [Racocetra fulgida]